MRALFAILALTASCAVMPARVPHSGRSHGRPPEQFIQSTHWAEVTDLSFSDDGRYLASASRDRTIRIWDVPRRRELRIIPFDGEITALAWDGSSHLMIGRKRDRSVLLDVERGVESSELGARSIAGPRRLASGPARWLAWGATGSRYADGLVTFDASGNRVSNIELPGRTYDATISIAQDGSAVGVSVRYSSDPPRLFHREGASFALSKVVWPEHPPDREWDEVVPAPGGKIAALVGGRNTSYVVGSGAPRAIAVGAGDAIERAAFAPGGGALAVTVVKKESFGHAGRLAVFDVARGAMRFTQPDGAETAVAFSPDGRTIASGDAFGRITLVDARSGRRLGALGQRIVGAGVLRFDGNDLVAEACDAITRWSLETGARLRHDAVPCDRARLEKLEEQLGDRDPESHRVRVTAPDGSTYTGEENGDLVVTRDGREIARGKSDGLAIEQIRVGTNGRLATLSIDGIIRIWDARTATVRVLFIDFEDDEWMATTPRGAYFGTPEVADRIGWVYEDPLEVHPFAQFEGRFESPEKVRRRLRGEAVEAPIDVPRPPSVRLLSAPTAPVRGDVATVRVSASSDSVATVRAFVESRLALEVHPSSASVDLEIPLRGGINHVSIVAFDESGVASNELPLEIESAAPAKTTRDVWVVAIGVSRYPHLLDAVPLPPAKRKSELDGLQLPAARRDAEAIARAFGSLAGAHAPYAKAHVSVLGDERADPDSIRRALRGLRDMGPEDFAVVFFAGHGLNPKRGADMVLATGRTRLAADETALLPDSLANDTVGWRDFADALARAKGRVLVLLDACHSGHFTQDLVAPNGALAERLLHDGRAGALVFAAAKGRQSSYESGPHGMFTSALLGSLADASSDRNHDGELQLSELVDATTMRVAEGSDGKQTPWVVRREAFGDFSVTAAPSR